MSKSRSPRIGHYFLGAAFAVFVSVCLGGLMYLVVAMLLPELEIPPDESNHAAIGVGALVAFVALLAQLWSYAMHRCLRPRRDFFRPSNPSDSPLH